MYLIFLFRNRLCIITYNALSYKLDVWRHSLTITGKEDWPVCIVTLMGYGKFQEKLLVNSRHDPVEAIHLWTGPSSQAVSTLGENQSILNAPPWPAMPHSHDMEGPKRL